MTFLSIVTGGDSEAGATTTAAASDANHGARPRGGVTPNTQPKQTAFVSVT